MNYKIIVSTAVKNNAVYYTGVFVYKRIEICLTPRLISHIKYLIHIYNTFQVSVCNKAFPCEKALTRNLEIGKIESIDGRHDEDQQCFCYQIRFPFLFKIHVSNVIIERTYTSSGKLQVFFILVW